MRKLLLSAIAVIFFLSIHAQVTESENNQARQLVTKNSAALGLSVADINNSIVANTYKITGRNDLRMVYLQQSFLGVPVFNELQVIAFQNDKVVSNAGTRIPGLDKKVNTIQVNPSVTVLDAVQRTLNEEGLVATEQLIPISINEDGLSYGNGITR